MNNEEIKKAEKRVVVMNYVEKNFDSIPSILFLRLDQSDLYEDKGDILQLVSSPYRMCFNCLERVYTKLIDDEIKWYCSNEDCYCSESTDNYHEYDDLSLAFPELDWPAGYSTLFWSQDDRVLEYTSRCGFFVYESPDFNGYLLAIDGVGYDFIDEHWTPLYDLLTQGE